MRKSKRFIPNFLKSVQIKNVKNTISQISNSTILSANNRKLHLARPVGMSEQASAVIARSLLAINIYRTTRARLYLAKNLIHFSDNYCAKRKAA